MSSYTVKYKDRQLDLEYHQDTNTYCFKVSQLLEILKISSVHKFIKVPKDITYLEEYAVYELVSNIDTPNAYTFFRWFLKEIKIKQRHFKYTLYVVFKDLGLSIIFAKTKEQQIEIETAKAYLLKIEDIDEKDIHTAIETLRNKVPERIDQLQKEMIHLLKFYGTFDSYRYLNEESPRTYRPVTE